MLPVQQPDLGSMFGAYSAGPTQVGWEQLQNARQNQAFNMAEAQRQQQEASAKAPFELQQLQQQARKTQLEADYAEKKQPFDLSKLQLEGDKQSAEEINRLGYTMQQAAGIHKAYGGIPPYLQSKFPKEILDALNTEGGADRVMNAGKALYEHSSGYLGQDQKGAQKQALADTAAETRRAAIEAANARADADRASRERIAAARLDNARRLASDKRSGSTNKQTLEQYAVELDKAAAELSIDNPQAAAVLKQRSVEAFAKASSLKAAGANVKDNFTREVMGMDKPATQQQQAPADPYAGFKIR